MSAKRWGGINPIHSHPETVRLLSEAMGRIQDLEDAIYRLELDAAKTASRPAGNARAGRRLGCLDCGQVIDPTIDGYETVWDGGYQTICLGCYEPDCWPHHGNNDGGTP